ncbi:MAG: hypothetical protein IH849_14865 [Acidobacteria bacterium]|nr:hypothetical protein [Acidobacteriota bacterium]
MRPESGWVADFDESNHPVECTLRSVGYWEVGSPRIFPDEESSPPMPRETVSRPGIGRIGISKDRKEAWVPDDIEDLWRSFKDLHPDKLEVLLRAGNAYLNADRMWPEEPTAYALFHVVACEALKPTGRQYDRLNVYDVVASLVGEPEARKLKDLPVGPQKVRSKYVHRGVLAAGELRSSFLLDDVFADPSFDEMLRELSSTCRTCLVEWLRCGGEYTVVSLPRAGGKDGLLTRLRRALVRYLPWTAAR